uniref:Uncharacterized protein n=1 Tax=Anguilla anguilla TaxID=7936 RepID=A0A0E9TH20_ANGAN
MAQSVCQITAFSMQVMKSLLIKLFVNLNLSIEAAACIDPSKGQR